MKIDWKTKLSSRKFWACIIGVVLSVMVMFGVDKEEQNKVVGLITACSTLAIYILSEGMVDGKHVDDGEYEIVEIDPEEEINDSSFD